MKEKGGDPRLRLFQPPAHTCVGWGVEDPGRGQEGKNGFFCLVENGKNEEKKSNIYIYIYLD